MKKIAIIIFLLIILMETNVFAATKSEVTMEIVEKNICTIDLNEDSSFEKKIISSNLKNHQVTLQLKITNNAEILIPEGELMLVIDSSQSMDNTLQDGVPRKDIVLTSANKLVKSLIDDNPSTLKIGVVTFSTGSKKNDEGYLITGTEADAQKVCDFTNDLSVLTNKISSIEGTGQYTNLDAGLQLAKQQFTNANTNKYMIILTDGLPNLAIGYNDLVSYKGTADVINKTKSTLASLNNINVITMLTGVDNEEAIFKTDATNSYTYKDVINSVFGTEENPTNGKFYKIDDAVIEQTITDDIYHDLLPIEKSLDNITILDYFPKYITDNFDVVLLSDNESDEKNAVIKSDAENNQYISWNIEKLAPKETKFLKYTLSLKDSFDESILDKIFDTNKKVDITYKDFDGTDKIKGSDVTPKIKLIAPPVPAPEPPQDVTVALDTLPKAGSPLVTFGFIMFLVVTTIFFGYKSR